LIDNKANKILGIALIVTALVDAKDATTLDLYHLRLIYDLVSFVGVGCAACSITWTYTSARVSKYKSMRHGPNRVSRWSPRHRSLYLFALLFAVLVVLFGIRLSEWSEEEEGRCYLTAGLSGSDADHPTSDMVYLAFTSIWLIAVLLFSALGGEKFMHSVLIAAALQYPVHLYFM
jgi:hypothetical protein